MRKLMAGLVIASVTLASAVGAVAATVQSAPPSHARFGQLNNRAVLGLAAADAADKVCTPSSPTDKSCESAGGDSSSGGFNPTLPLVVGASGLAFALAAGGGGGPSSP